MSGAANSFLARAQYNNESTPASVSSSVIADTSSIVLPFSVNPLYPIDYEQLVEAEMASDLDTPSNIKTEAEYDFESGCYEIGRASCRERV